MQNAIMPGVSGASNMPRKRESLAPEVIELLLISKSMLDRVDTEMRKSYFPDLSEIQWWPPN